MLENLDMFAVVPFAGTWIEIFGNSLHATTFKSFPSRERGLKFDNSGKIRILITSFPSRERGLKSSNLMANENER